VQSFGSDVEAVAPGWERLNPKYDRSEDELLENLDVL
jgi:hypothetical protein